MDSQYKDINNGVYDESLDNMLNMGSLENCDLFKDRNELKIEKIRELEREIYNNSTAYIDLMEKEENDKSSTLFAVIEKLKDKKEIIESSNFKLSDTMNCYEYNHNTMDMRINYNTFENYKTITKKYGEYSEWDSEKILIFVDRLFLEECQFLFNNIFPTQSILSCVLFHYKKSFDFDNHTNLFLNISKHIIYLSTEMILNSTSSRDMNLIPNHKLLEVKDIDKEIKNAINKLMQEIEKSNDTNNKKILGNILNRLNFKKTLIDILNLSLKERSYSEKSFLEIEDSKIISDLLNNLEECGNTLVQTFSNIFPNEIEDLFQKGLYKYVPIVCNIKKVISYDVKNLQNDMSKLFQGFRESLLILNETSYYSLLINLPEFADKYNYSIIRCFTEIFIKDKNSNLSNGMKVKKMIEVSFNY